MLVTSTLVFAPVARNLQPAAVLRVPTWRSAPASSVTVLPMPAEAAVTCVLAPVMVSAG